MSTLSFGWSNLNVSQPTVSSGNCSAISLLFFFIQSPGISSYVGVVYCSATAWRETYVDFWGSLHLPAAWYSALRIHATVASPNSDLSHLCSASLGCSASAHPSRAAAEQVPLGESLGSHRANFIVSSQVSQSCCRLLSDARTCLFHIFRLILQLFM